MIYTNEVVLPTPTTDGMDTYAPMDMFMREHIVIENTMPETPMSDGM